MRAPGFQSSGAFQAAHSGGVGGPLVPSRAFSGGVDYDVPELSRQLVDVRSSDSAGYYVVATQDIEAGELIMAGEEALGFAVADEWADQACHWSLKPLDPEEELPLRCASSGMPIYASAAARDAAEQDGALRAHSMFYDSLGAISGIGMKDTAPLRMLLQLLSLKQSHPGRYAKACALCSNRDRLDSKTLKAASTVAALAAHLLGQHQGLEVSLEQALSLLLKLYCNTFSARDVDCHVEGVALFSFGSRFNHSCDPNCTHYTMGNRLYVRTLRDIRKGQEITISYVALYQTRVHRLRHLSSSYSFVCSCSRCQAEKLHDSCMSSFVCRQVHQGLKCAGVVSLFGVCPELHRSQPSWGRCSECCCAPDPEHAARLLDDAAKVKALVQAATDDQEAVKALRQCEKVLGPSSALLLELRLDVVKVLGSSADARRELLMVLMNVVESLQRAPYLAHADTGYHAACLGELLMRMLMSSTEETERNACMKMAVKQLSRAMMCIDVARGEEHPMSKSLGAKLQMVTAMKATHKKLGMVQKILDKKKLREATPGERSTSSAPTS